MPLGIVVAVGEIVDLLRQGGGRGKGERPRHRQELEIESLGHVVDGRVDAG